MTESRIFAWDFDGVLNRNIVDGAFIWQRQFETDLGLPLDSFVQFMFPARFQRAMVGEADLITLVDEWLTPFDTSLQAWDVVQYWFAKDAHPDPAMHSLLEIAQARGFRNVIATNNDPYRTAYIAAEMGYETRVEHIFSAGRLGVAKPDNRYFHAVTDSLNVAPQNVILIDDTAENVEAALACGWQGVHYVPGSAVDLEAWLSGL